MYQHRVQASLPRLDFGLSFKAFLSRLNLGDSPQNDVEKKQTKAPNVLLTFCVLTGGGNGRSPLIHHNTTPSLQVCKVIWKKAVKATLDLQNPATPLLEVPQHPGCTLSNAPGG
ncbi:unnamed protein product [Pleuronectes platessa]|uniref:Uncharacterized protein n=1 Tax=Pleuronectes platessa TaxID=8262 RepID=A0A9N7TT51_PLEPL|nr:unnamed protein product [Pleuronectes platessa]